MIYIIHFSSIRTSIKYEVVYYDDGSTTRKYFCTLYCVHVLWPHMYYGRTQRAARTKQTAVLENPHRIKQCMYQNNIPGASLEQYLFMHWCAAFVPHTLAAARTHCARSSSEHCSGARVSCVAKLKQPRKLAKKVKKNRSKQHKKYLICLGRACRPCTYEY